ncbi:MAG: hypothetical protein ACRBG0_26150 [Lewinella sp.]|jgi:hypothetical protein|uniref:hypothetical protein n=1 Tax=Lewinella sp. TaxID=2004506 RepID=UPI003D6C4BC5
MDYLWQVHYDYSWGGLLSISIQLALFYFALQLAHRILIRISAPANWQLVVDRYVRYGLLLFEPIVVLVIGSYFMLIKPFFHGLIVLLLLLACLRQLRNYFSGRILLFDHNLKVGTRLNHQDFSGLITYIGRLGLRLQTNKGLHFLNFEDLLKDGYTLLIGEKNSSFFRLKINVAEKEDNTAKLEQLQELLQVVPYLNWLHRPQITTTNPTDQPWLVEIALHDEKHLKDLIQRLEEQDFSARTTKI